MSERRGSSGQGSRPSPTQHASEQIVTHAEQTTGRGMLSSAGVWISEVDYAATLMEAGGAFEKGQGPIYTGHGIIAPAAEGDFDHEALELVLQMEDGRSLPIEIESRVRDRGYRFQVMRPR